MRTALVGLCLAVSAALFAAPSLAQTVSTSFNADWVFAKGDLLGAETANAPQAPWQKVDLPHDWAIAGPFDRNAASTGSGGWLPTGVAWYRKTFTLPAADKGRRVFVEFDGVMERSGVWINGVHIGHRPNGYSSFRYELTDHLKWGQPNVMAVRADTSAQPASRWYAGGGIYRHVRLITRGPIHVQPWGSFVTTPKIDAASATVMVESELVNQSKAERNAYLEVTLVGPDGKAAATARGAAVKLPVGRSTKLVAETVLANPRRWDLDDPALYRAELKIKAEDGTLLDNDTVNFGVREMIFRAESGFWLNGRNIKLKGTAIHADGGAFGMAVPLSFYERRLKGLQALGVNAIRTAHHPFGPEFLDLCDRLGMVVMNEAFDMWTVAKNPHDYHLFFTDWSSIDARDFVKRDRNHPSVALWSIGNEIHDTAYPVVTKSILARLKRIFNTEDPSRPVTMALFRPNTTGDYQNGVADMLDVVGQNYRERELTKAHTDKPTRKIIGTENGKNRVNWLAVRDFPPYAGMFLWTGVDYLGEADRNGWPNISNPSGLVDRTDVVKPIGWERASWWSDKPVVKIARRLTEVIDTSELPTMVGVAMPQPRGPGVLADWTPADQKPHVEKVEVYSNVPVVELFLNGNSLGKRPRNADDSARQWEVAFEPGTLKAVGYSAQGDVLASSELQTAGPAAAIRLTPEQARLAPGFDNIGFVRVEVVDAKGVLVPNFNQALTVSVSGPATLAAFDNGGPTDSTAFLSPVRQAWNGRALVMLRATDTKGKIELKLRAAGLQDGNAALEAVSKQ